MKLRLLCLVSVALAAVLSQPVSAATADKSFEFSHKPALDGAGWMVQPVGNIRASGNMAYSGDDPADEYNVPVEPTPVAGIGMALNNGDGTFKYDGEPVAMGLIQGKGTGNAGNPPVPSPLLNQKNFTMEARFKVTRPVTPIDQNHHVTYFAFENNALGSVHFNATYGRNFGQDGNETIAMSFPGAARVGSGTDLPLVFEAFVKFRIVTEDVGGGQGKVSSYLDYEDGMGWKTGPTQTYAPSTTRDRGSLVRALTDGGASGGTSIDVDYIRWKAAALTTSEALNAPAVAPGCAGNLNGDGTTDGADVAIIYNAWGTNDATADIDDSGTVDGADLGVVFNCWGMADTAGVPEPTSIGGLAVCLVALLTGRRRI